MCWFTLKSAFIPFAASSEVQSLFIFLVLSIAILVSKADMVADRDIPPVLQVVRGLGLMVV